jgi:hypothetical protein
LATLNLNLKKTLVVAVLGAVLFVGSFVASDRINASNIPCGPENIWFDVFGIEQCGPASGQPAGGELWMASYYGYSHAGSPTASGELYDPAAFTAAHKSMPFGSQLLVSHGDASVQVTVNDRGPFADGLDIDLSWAAADSIGLTSLGVAPVEVVVL